MKTSNSVFQKVYSAPFVARQTSPAVVSASDKLGSGEKGAETKRKAAWQRNRHWQDPEQASSDKAGTLPERHVIRIDCRDPMVLVRSQNA